MRHIQALVFSITTLLALTTLTTPAAALTQQQWTSVCMNFLGLRSGENARDANGAGYGLDNGNTAPLDCLKPAPAGWDQLLGNTLTLIKGFENSGPRYLLIVGKCPGQARDYAGAFPKCNRIRGGVLAHTPQTLAHYSVAQLVAWVNTTLR